MPLRLNQDIGFWVKAEIAKVTTQIKAMRTSTLLKKVMELGKQQLREIFGVTLLKR